MPRADRFAGETPPADPPPPDSPPAMDPPAAEQKPPAPAVYRVAPGKSLVCRRGTLNEGDAIEARDVDDQKHLDELVDAGAVVKAAR